MRHSINLSRYQRWASDAHQIDTTLNFGLFSCEMPGTPVVENKLELSNTCGVKM